MPFIHPDIIRLDIIRPDIIRLVYQQILRGFLWDPCGILVGFSWDSSRSELLFD